MKIRSKIAYSISGILGFLPLSVLVILQSIFALEASYDSKLVIDANKITITDVLVYDGYNELITELYTIVDENGQPLLFSIIEATKDYAIINIHGGKVANSDVRISSIQFVLSDGTKTELLHGIVYLQFKNVATTITNPNWVRDTWIREFAESNLNLYKLYYEQPAGTISYIWLKIITASLGTLIGIVTVILIVLRKSTKALVKKYWRISVLVALFEGTLILGLIAWLIVDIFQVFAAATVGWALFLGTEKLAKIKGYLDTNAVSGESPELLPEQVAAIHSSVEAVLAKYRK
jgi:hypothetical protein